jgi:predicted GTPase
VGNKWDLVPNKEEQNFYHARLYRQLYRFHFAPVIFTSALENKQVLKILAETYGIYEKLGTTYKAQEVTRVIKEIVAREKYKTMTGDYFTPKYAAVETTRPFFFVFSCTKPDHLKPSVEIHFKKKLSDAFQLTGIPLFIKIIRSSHKPSNLKPAPHKRPS